MKATQNRIDRWHELWWAVLDGDSAKFWPLRNQTVQEYPDHIFRGASPDSETGYFNVGMMEWEILKREILWSGF